LSASKPRAIRVTAAVIERGGRVLIARRREGGPRGGLWEFPGGKIEGDETPERCLERELREELGIEAKAGSFLCSTRHDYGSLIIELLAYRVTSYRGSARALEHAETRWVSVAELDGYEFPAADEAILRKLKERSVPGR
jgi:8-oxo-dGTP diphosphatase